MSKQSNKPSQLRAQAETQFAHVPEKAWTPRPAEELLHELQVYQIELEMQNETLRQAQIELEESRDRYVDLYDFAPVGYLTLTSEALIAEVNLTGAALLGVERKELLLHRFAHFIAEDYSDSWYLFLESFLQRDERQSCELVLKHSNGQNFHAHLDCLHIKAGNGETLGAHRIYRYQRAQASRRSTPHCRYRLRVTGGDYGDRRSRRHPAGKQCLYTPHWLQFGRSGGENTSATEFRTA